MIRRSGAGLVTHIKKRLNGNNQTGTNMEPRRQTEQGETKNTWRRSTELDVKNNGLMWKQLERRAQDRQGWKRSINGLCSERNIKA